MAVLESSVLGNLVLEGFVFGNSGFENFVFELGGLEIAALQSLGLGLPLAVRAVAAVQLRGATPVFARAALAVVGEVAEEPAQDFAGQPHPRLAGSSDAAGVNWLAAEAP